VKDEKLRKRRLVMKGSRVGIAFFGSVEILLFYHFFAGIAVR